MNSRANAEATATRVQVLSRILKMYDEALTTLLRMMAERRAAAR